MSLLIKGLDMPKLDENEEHLWVPGWIEVGKDGKAIFAQVHILTLTQFIRMQSKKFPHRTAD